MNKFNLPRRSMLKDRRAKRSAQRRLRSGTSSLKLPTTRPLNSISGKRQRRFLRTRRRIEEIMKKALMNLQDIEMMPADNADGHYQSQEEQKQHSKVHFKKKARLMLKKSKKQVQNAEGFAAGKEGNPNEDAMMQ